MGKNITEQNSIDESRIKSIIKSLTKKNVYQYQPALIQIIMGVMMIQLPQVLSTLSLNSDKADVVKTESIEGSATSIAAAAQSLTASIEALTSFMISGFSIFGVMIFVMGIFKLKKAADTPQYSSSASEIKDYSLKELIYTVNYLSKVKKSKQEPLLTNISEYLKEITKDENILKLKEYDIEEYIEEYEENKRNEEKNKLIKERDEIDRKIKGNNVTIEDYITLEME